MSFLIMLIYSNLRSTNKKLFLYQVQKQLRLGSNHSMFNTYSRNDYYQMAS